MKYFSAWIGGSLGMILGDILFFWATSIPYGAPEAKALFHSLVALAIGIYFGKSAAHEK